jgi:hypothetical protein
MEGFVGVLLPPSTHFQGDSARLPSLIIALKAPVIPMEMHECRIA